MSTSLPSPITTVPSLNLGTIISKEIESDQTFSLLDENISDEGRPFVVNADLIATGRTCVIGSSGSGKSYAVGVICEELCKNQVPFVIIDIEGEYSGLKEKYEAIWVGEDENSDIKWSSNKVDLKLLARYAPDCPPLILDLSETDRAREKVGIFLISIYREISNRRTPYLVILEEADRFAPQVGDRLQIFDEVARRGRKRGLGLMLCTQRPSLVDKNVLSQCANQLIGKLVIKNDLNSVAQFFPGRGTPNQLTGLQAGEFYALGGMSPESVCVKIRTRETRHGGITPKLDPTAVRPSVANILSALESETPLTRTIVDSTKQVSMPLVSAMQSNAPLPNVSNVKTMEVEEDEEGAPQRQQQQQEEAEEDLNEALDDPDQDTSDLKIPGLRATIEQNQVPALINVEKSHKIFGQKETIASVSQAFRPLIEVGVRTRTGIIKKKFETIYFLLDGLSGRLFEQSDRLSFKSGIERLLGLEEGHILVLRVLFPDKDQSTIEISSACKIQEDQVRKLVRELESQRLVRSSRLGRIKVYRRIVDIPKIELSKQLVLDLVELGNEGIPTAKFQRVKIKEPQVREIVKGMWEGADVESFRIFYYPLYRVELVRNSKSRYMMIDGRTGNELALT